MISIRNLTKSYPLESGDSHLVIDDASLTIPPGKNIALLGENGAGKSTLMRILAGVEESDDGEIISPFSFSWPVTLRGALQPNMSGRDNCWLILSLHGYSRAFIKEKLQHIQEISNIGEYFYEPTRTYSSGMRVRLSFALCMAFDYDYFLLDEITSVGDAQFRETCRNWLLAKDQKHNIILVSHQMNIVKEFCEIAVVVKDRKLHLYNNIDEAIAPFMDQE